MPRKGFIKPRKKRMPRRTPENSRERKVLFAIRALFPNEPYIYQGYYSWLEGAVGEPLQLDIFFTSLGCLQGLPLAIEVQGEQHRGRWRSGIKGIFSSKDSFDRLRENDKIKKDILIGRGIPLLEIWPEDKLTPEALTKKIEAELGVKINAPV